jgi:hypothetical protein
MPHRLVKMLVIPTYQSRGQQFYRSKTMRTLLAIVAVLSLFAATVPMRASAETASDPAKTTVVAKSKANVASKQRGKHHYAKRTHHKMHFARQKHHKFHYAKRHHRHQLAMKYKAHHHARLHHKHVQHTIQQANAR